MGWLGTGFGMLSHTRSLWENLTNKKDLRLQVSGNFGLSYHVWSNFWGSFQSRVSLFVTCHFFVKFRDFFRITVVSLFFVRCHVGVFEFKEPYDLINTSFKQNWLKCLVYFERFEASPTEAWFTLNDLKQVTLLFLWGMLIINQHVANDIRHLLAVYDQLLPVIVEIPSKHQEYDVRGDEMMVTVARMLGRKIETLMQQ